MTADAMSTPPADIDIDEALIRRLLRAQHRDLADLPLRIMESGWDNVMVRLGEDLALRLPRRAVADRLIRNEQKWLPSLAPALPLPIPAPLRTGVPGEGFPFHWSVLRWLPGEAADLAPPNADQASILAMFLQALHQSVPPDAPANSVRDCPLEAKRSRTEARMQKLSDLTDLITPDLFAIWDAALAAPIDVSPTWIAGDIHARNVLVQNGKLSAFIDWGDMCAGDRATDLASIWALFEAKDARRTAIEAYGMSEATLARARGWAVFYGVFLLDTGLQDTPRHAVMGELTLRRVLEEAH